MISPLTALLIDALATFINQFGLIQMKKAHQDAEKQGKKHGVFTVRWLTLGLLCVLLGNVGHVFVMPYGDMTLFITTCSVAILFSGMLSIFLLGEKFIWQYDITACILICVGAGLTVLQMNTTILVSYDRALVKSYLVSWTCLILITFTTVLGLFALWSYLALKKHVK